MDSATDEYNSAFVGYLNPVPGIDIEIELAAAFCTSSTMRRSGLPLAFAFPLAKRSGFVMLLPLICYSPGYVLQEQKTLAHKRTETFRLPILPRLGPVRRSKQTHLI
jgi:hypothetical protein